MNNGDVIFSATDSDKKSSKSEVVTVNSFEELIGELESRGDLL
jgi:hypothetical protein